MYVVVTGSKNNAGDYLIKKRALELFSEFRPEKRIVDINAWESISDDDLAKINASDALILLGGPSLQKSMYPDIYKLRENLSDITVPITTMGVGWKSISGDWIDTYDYPFTDSTRILLDRISQDGLPISVRDYHSMNVLAHKGYKNILMTGCPAYYSPGHFKVDPAKTVNPKKVAFSLGVSFIHSPSMERVMKDNILVLKEHFSDSEFEVVFHHGLDPVNYLSSPGSDGFHNLQHIKFSQWLKDNDIAFVDISGSAEKLMSYYMNVDVHVGYRVHAHIFMNSISKHSILIAEDGRAKAIPKVISGLVFDGFTNFNDSFLAKIMNRLFKKYDRYEANDLASNDVIHAICGESNSAWGRVRQSRSLINSNFLIMEKFMRDLP